MQQTQAQLPRLVIGAPHGRSGKTSITLGLVAAWRRRGLRVVVFKKGPDFIDAAWLTQAAGQSCHNLDLYLMDPQTATESFLVHASQGDLSVVEGNMGLYDGMDLQGSNSTAALARLLNAPVVLVLDATRVTRTAAAIILGCQHFDPQLRIAGVILNRVGGARHERTVRTAIQEYCGLPVFGAVPRLPEPPFRERHLGLVPPPEAEEQHAAIARMAAVVADSADLEALADAAAQAGPLAPPPRPHLASPAAPVAPKPEAGPGNPVKIGVLRDRAFQFYYPENLEALKRHGARLVFLDACRDTALPADLDGLYIGGGFPETNSPALAGNRTFRQGLRDAIEAGLPVYAECGGLIYLCRQVQAGAALYPMVGVFPYTVRMEKRPQGHGYTLLTVQRPNPYFPVGSQLRGHEFHYSRVEIPAVVPRSDGLFGRSLEPVFRVQRGHGLDGQGDGLLWKNTLACYTHLHALGVPHWAQALVAQARNHAERRAASGQPHGGLSVPWQWLCGQPAGGRQAQGVADATEAQAPDEIPQALAGLPLRFPQGQ